MVVHETSPFIFNEMGESWIFHRHSKNAISARLTINLKVLQWPPQHWSTWDQGPYGADMNKEKGRDRIKKHMGALQIHAQTNWQSVRACQGTTWQPHPPDNMSFPGNPSYTHMWRHHRKLTCCFWPWLINQTANWGEDDVQPPYVCAAPVGFLHQGCYRSHPLIFATNWPLIISHIQLVWSSGAAYTWVRYIKADCCKRLRELINTIVREKRMKF